MFRGEINLESGERLLWQCSSTSTSVRRQEGLILLALVAATVGLAVAFVATGTGWYVVAAAVAGYTAFRWSRRRKALDSAEYFVTDRRIVVQTDIGGAGEERVYRITDLPSPELIMHRDGTGTVVFAHAETQRKRRLGIKHGHDDEEPLRLAAIEQARPIRDHVLRYRQSAEDLPEG